MKDLHTIYLKYYIDDDTYRVYELITTLFASSEMILEDLREYHEYLGTDINLSDQAIKKVYPFHEFIVDKIYYNEMPNGCYDLVVIPRAKK